MHGGQVAQLPGTGVRLIEDRHRQPPQFLQALEQDLVPGQGQAPVEEGMGGGKDDAAIDVVLHLEMGLVADPHRPHPPVARQGGGDALLEIGAASDAIAGPQAAVLALPDDIGDVAQVLFHGAGGPQAIEGGDDEIGVPQPAEAIIPVAFGPRGLGNGGGEGGDDGAGLLETAQLEGDGGADDLILPLEGDGQGAHPAMPVVEGPLQKGTGGLGDAGGQAFIGAEDEVQRPVEEEGGLLDHIGQGGVGGQAHRAGVTGVADMIGAQGLLRHLLPIGKPRAHPQPQPRQALDRGDAPHQGGRSEDAVVLVETGREVGDLRHVALAVLQFGDQHGGVELVALAADRQVPGGFHGEIATLVPFPRAIGLGAPDQGAEEGVAIQPGKTAPEVGGPGVDEGGQGTVTNGAQFQRGPIVRCRHGMLL